MPAEMRDEIRKRNIEISIVFTAGIRVDFFDEEIAQILKDMGVYSLSFGIESGNQTILDNVKKGIRLDQVRKAVKVAKDYGFEIWAFFILGLYGDTEETIKDTVEFAKELDPDIAKFHILVPYPGTEIHNQLMAKGFILSKDYSRYGIHTRPIHRLEKLTPDDMVRLQKKAYRDFYLRPRIILKQLMRINSWNRLKLNAKAGVSIFKTMLTG
jgi:anaerobic magnesium-protoporphyrin IX monomethyl ester cyclase